MRNVNLYCNEVLGPPQSTATEFAQPPTANYAFNVNNDYPLWPWLGFIPVGIPMSEMQEFEALLDDSVNNIDTVDVK